MITIIARNGPPTGITCPMVLCEVCREPITERGNALWRTEYADDRTFTCSEVAYVHKGCDDAFTLTNGDGWSSAELDEFLAQLAYNFAHPARAEPNVEYVAPRPSSWRLGRYLRERSTTS